MWTKFKHYVPPYTSTGALEQGRIEHDDHGSVQRDFPAADSIHRASILHTATVRDTNFLREVTQGTEALLRDLEFLHGIRESVVSTPQVPFEFDSVRHFQPELKRRKQLNPTLTMQTIYQAKHGVTDAEMSDLVAMAQHPQFNPRDLRSGKTVRRARDMFPLMPLFSVNVPQKVVPFYDENGDYVSTTMTEFPFFSLLQT